MVDLHLVVAAAEAHVVLRLSDDVVGRVTAPAAAAVGGDLIGHRAPELVERYARGLADDVPEPDVERGQRVGRHALTLDAAVGAVHALPQTLDEHRILADQERLEPRLE